MLRFLLFKILLLQALFPNFNQVKAQTLSIKIYNQTGYDLDSLYFENHYLGAMKKDSAILIRNIDSFTVIGELPLHRPKAVVRGMKTKKNHAECLTKARQVKTGKYRFDLKSYEDELGLRFYWALHL